MANNNKATGDAAIAASVALGNEKRTITPPAFGVQQGAAFVLAMATADERGVTLADARIRYAAVGGPVWGEPWGRADLHWFNAHDGKSGQKQGGRTHEFVHRGDPATVARVACIGHGRNAAPCDVTAPNMGSDGDGNEVRTWRYTGAVLPPTFDGSDRAEIVALAAGRLAHYVEVVATTYYGGNKGDALALPYFAQFVKADTGLKAGTKAIRPSK